MGDPGKPLQTTSVFPSETDRQPDHSRGVLAATEETVEYGLFGENRLSTWMFLLADGIDVSRAAVLHALLKEDRKSVV